MSIASPLHASLTGVDLFKNVEYTQTSGAAPTTPVGYFAALREFMANPGDFNQANVAYPGPASPQNLTLSNPTVFLFQTPFLPSQSAIDAAYPFGTYTYTAINTGTSNTQSTSITYTTDAYTANIPALTAGTFNALQGMNAGSSFTLNFNSFTPNPSASVGETFLTIFGSSFGTTGLPNTATSLVLPANTLAPGTTYTYEVDFSDRISGNNNGVPTTIGFDVRTDGTFTTASASPEPGSLVLAALGVAALAFGIRKRAVARQSA
jgi:hypothetical protein